MRDRVQILGKVKRLLPTLSLLCLLLATTAGFIAFHEPAPQAPTSGTAAASITLPLEVIGPDGYTVSVTVFLDDPTNVTRLYVQANNLAYKLGQDGKGSLRINTGSWIPLTNGNVSCLEPEATLGCIGGARSTVRFTVPVSGLLRGENTISFRFNGTDGFSIGYRILALNLLRQDGSPVLAPSVFAHDDPATWQAPRASEADRAAGALLWHSAALVEQPGGPQIKATCSSCHFEDGQDLKYFNYSNHSIIERAKFHGLSAQQAEQVASYIRSLDVVNPGRPWNPPFQPGQGLSGKPADEWMAGAGLEAVLDRDEQMPLPEGFDLAGTLSGTDLPIAQELPSWNMWLPRVYPGDAFGQAFLTQAAYTTYTSTGWGSLSPAAFDGKLTTLANQADQAKRSLTSETNPTPEEIDAMLSVYQWAAVKQLEVSSLHDMFDKAPQVYGAHGAKRSLLGQARNFFNLGPHIIISNTWNTQPMPYGSPKKNGYLTSLWYTVQLLTNDGNKENNAIKPVDWKYQYRFLRQGEDYGVFYPHLYVHAMVKQWQQGWDKIPGEIYWRHHTIGWLFDQAGTNTWAFQKMEPKARAALLSRAVRAFNSKLYKHAPSAWPRGGDYLRQLSVASSTCQDEGTSYTLQKGSRDYIPYEDHFYMAISDMVDYGVDPYVADSTRDYAARLWPSCDWAALMPEPGPAGEAPQVWLTSPPEGAVYGEGDDVELRAEATDGDGSVVKVEFFVDGEKLGEDATAPYSYTWRGVVAGSYTLTAKATDNYGAITISSSVDITVDAPGEGLQVSIEASRTDVKRLLIEATVSGGTVAKVEFFEGSDKLGEGTEAPYSFTWENVPPGTYSLTAVATDSSLNATTSAPLTVVVEGAEQTISLVKGWNVASLSVAPSDARLETVLAPILEHIIIVKNGAGQVFFPQYGINEIGEWDPHEAYMMALVDTVSLTVEGVRIQPEVVQVDLVAGWDLVPYLYSVAMPIAEALTSIQEELVMVKDRAGRLYSPVLGINEIGMMQPGQGYQIYVSMPAVLVYPPNPAEANIATGTQPVAKVGMARPDAPSHPR